jgi:hypothetical protein
MNPNLNTKGRKPGAVNKTSKKTKELIANIVEENLEQVQKDIAGLKPSERINVVIKLLDYVVPKQKSIEVNDVSESLFKPITINHN